MNRRAVKMDTETIPVSGVDDLEKHLDQLMDDPTLPPDNKLFDDVELQMTGMYNACAYNCAAAYSS
jgi:hypothetical protein